MKSNIIIIVIVSVFGGLLALSRLPAAKGQRAVAYEYATIRWGGKENTHIIRPGGTVEFIGPELRKAPRPDRTDERSFYLNLAMNGLTKEGWEFAGISNDDIVMKRPTIR